MLKKFSKIIVIFKTHLDIGFTDFAGNVTENYMKNYLPNAMSVAKQMRGEKERFIWTVGSWMIEKYLEEGEHPEMLEDAIRRGEVRWHGLPFTTHTELMDEELFSYGLGISGKLDKRFGKHTIAAKMTDVPGHTKAMVPLLYRAGIRFLHIGVNPASTRPSVPDLFRWRADGGEELVVMYNSDYGKLTAIGESGVAVHFAHTGDNKGPQSAEEIREIYRKLHEEYPRAELCSGTLEDVAEIAVRQEGLPVIDSEIGDSWIHGVGTDPGKVSWFRALLRLKDCLPAAEMEKIYKELLLVPEHTWGLDEKTHLGYFGAGVLRGEYQYFVRSEFEAVRHTAKFRKMEKSWQEQREYIGRAVNALSGEARTAAEQAVRQYRRKETDAEGWQEVKTGDILVINGWNLAVAQSGALNYLQKDSRVLADENHPLGQFLYEVFSQKEYDRFRQQYVTSDEEWAIEDFGKIGVDKALAEHKRFLPKVKQILTGNGQLVIRMELPDEATKLYGGMDALEMLLDFAEDAISFDFAWFGKKASRIPEASWLQFFPNDRIVSMQKLGQRLDVSHVIDGGNKHLHAVTEGIQMSQTELTSLDAPLVALGKPWLLEFTDEAPDMGHGVFINLHNNIWGTNFPMWYDEDARFRFVIGEMGRCTQ